MTLVDVTAAASTQSAWETAGPYVASTVALVAAAVSYLIARANRTATRRQERVVFRRTQLAEFYEPLAMLRMTTRELRKSLPSTEADGSRWRLVQHIEEVKRDAGRRAVAEAILALNAQVEQILTEKAALIEGDRPPSLDKFMRHSRLLKIAWDLEERTDTGVGIEDVPFPDEIDEELEVGRSEVRAALEDLERG